MPKPKKHTRSVIVHCRVPDALHVALKREAARRGLGISAWLRMIAIAATQEAK